MPGDSRFQFVANHLAVDFVNTEIMDAGSRIDLLEDFESLIDWLKQAGLLDEQARRSLLRKFAGPELRAVTMKEAKRLRTAIRSALESGSANADLSDSLLKHVNHVLRQAVTHREIVRGPGGFAFTFHSEWNTPLQLLAPVAESFADLLVRGDLHLIRKCENPDCILHIYDSTKNQSRRWCSMAGCGNRHKVNAYRRRSRAAP